MVKLAPMTMENIVPRCFLMIIFVAVEFSVTIFFFRPLICRNEIDILTFKIFFPIWTIVSILWLWAFIVSSWLDAGSVKQELVESGYSQYQLTSLPQKFDVLDKCSRCHLPKPARAQHCHICKQCYFNYDHHCQFIGNCIALRNSKAFMLFLIYSALIFLQVGIIILIEAYHMNRIEKKAANMLFFILFMFIFADILFACMYIPTVLEYQAFEYENSNLNHSPSIFSKSFLKWIDFFLPTPSNISGFAYSGHSELSEQILL